MSRQDAKIAPVWRDHYLWLAVGAAVPLWFALYLWAEPALNLRWPLNQPAVFLQLVLLYPLLEEIVFRGAVQTTAHRYLPSRSLGPISLSNLVTSFLFTAMHFLYHSPLWASLVIIPSLVFGYFKERHGTLSAPVLLHVCYNTGYYLIFEPAL